MRHDPMKSLLCALPLILLAAPIHAQQTYYCDETINNNPPFPCWLVGTNKGKCPSRSSADKWNCRSVNGWTPVGPGSGGGGSTYTNAWNPGGWSVPDLTSPALAHDGGQGRVALLEIEPGRVAAGTAEPVLTLGQPGPDPIATELRLVREANGDHAKLIVVRVVGETPDADVIAVVPLDDEHAIARVAWRIDDVDGPVLDISLRATRLRLELPVLDASSTLTIPSTPAASIRLDVDQPGPTDVHFDR